MIDGVVWLSGKGVLPENVAPTQKRECIPIWDGQVQNELESTRRIDSSSNCKNSMFEHSSTEIMLKVLK